MRSRVYLSKLFASCIEANSIAQLHSLFLRSGLLAAADCFFATRLASAYSKLRHVQDARKIFDEIPHPNTFLYNAVLRAHFGARQLPQTLHLFRRMTAVTSLSDRPDNFTLSIVLRACAGLSALRHGQAIHGLVVKMQQACSDLFVGSSLVEMYSRCGEMGDAVAVLDGFPDPDVVLRTSVITGYQQNGNFEEAVSFFSRMLVGEGVAPVPVTLISVVSAIGQLGDLRLGKSCHGFLVRMGFQYALSLVNSVLNMYAKLGEIRMTRNLFDMMPERDVITWSCMISCYAQNGNAVEALDVYKRMIEVGVEPNSITLVSVLRACTLALDLGEGRKVHEFATQRGYDSELVVSTALVDMYMKCSCYTEAIGIFYGMPKKDVVSWAAVIGGYAQNGMANEALKVFQDMLSDGPIPDAVTMVKVLTASSLLGVVRLAVCLHCYLIKSGFDNKVFVGAALVDLYSKSGSLGNAVEVFETVSDKDAVLWSSMIAAYGMHGLGTKAIATFERMIQSSITPSAVTFMTLLSACSHAGLVEQGRRIFDSMSHVYGVTPTSEHCGIMVDLLGRTGELEEAFRLIERMPGPVDPHVWCALLAGCAIHHNIDMGEMAARILLKQEAEHAGYYKLLSNIYAFDGKWDQMVGVKKLLMDRGLRKTPAYSSVEVNNEVHAFLAGEGLHQG